MEAREERLSTDDIATGTQPRDDERAAADRDDGQAGENLAATGDGSGARRDEPLLPAGELEDFRERWEQVQTQFVDEPRRAVEDADALVAEVMKRLADSFSSERSDLETQWDRAGEADTETLRVTLQRYRSFFNRLLSA